MAHAIAQLIANYERQIAIGGGGFFCMRAFNVILHSFPFALLIQMGGFFARFVGKINIETDRCLFA